MDPVVDAPELAARYMRLVDGFVTTQLLCVAAALDVGGRLAGGPMSGPDLAASLGVDRTALAAYDFTGLRRLVDVGGGPAVTLAEILRAVPGLTGVLMDREAVLPRAREHLRRTALATAPSACR
jgi:hypothetical protein